MTLAEALHPSKIHLSGKMTAIFAFILDEKWTDPAINWMHVTTEGVVETDAEFLGTATSPMCNLQGARPFFQESDQ